MRLCCGYLSGLTYTPQLTMRPFSFKNIHGSKFRRSKSKVEQARWYDDIPSKKDEFFLFYQ